MMTELKNMFQKQASQELYETYKLLQTCKMEEGQSVSSHVLKMKSYIDRLEKLGTTLPPNLAVNTVLVSLPKSYHQFVMNYNMLKTAEQDIPYKVFNPGVLMIRDSKVRKNKPKTWEKGKGKSIAKKKIPPPPKKENPAKDVECFHCGKVGHWRRNCPSYLSELRKGKAGQTSKSGNEKK
ncbi:uncharacterized protein [Rutidosis leptorrhynchoides]|uniref:uncharacterized protein n=1 Tax=Rutidosis leptorrhynchoides TaxID=125765 RepID=UPI003A9A351B